MRTLVGILAVLAGLAASQARIITVDDDNPADFSTIQVAIDDANDGDTVLVADGTYTGDGNRDIDFHGKAITVKSQNGPENCIIDCNASEAEPHRGFYFHSGEENSSLLKGLTVTKGYIYVGNGGGVYCAGASPKIENCVITRNEVHVPPGSIGLKAYGGGIYCGAGANPEIVSCIISGNTAGPVWDAIWSYPYGGGIYCTGSAGLTIANCVISSNAAGAGGGILSNSSDGVSVMNCTIADNLASAGGGVATYGTWTLTNSILWDNTPDQIPSYTIRLLVRHCDIKGGWPGDGNIAAHPYFADPDRGDYHLKSEAGRWDPNSESWIVDQVTSPCIDAGDPMSAIGFELFPNGGIINMGAYGGTVEASKSYFGEPPCETIVAGDINGDCLVDFRDFCMMSLHWIEEH